MNRESKIHAGFSRRDENAAFRQRDLLSPSAPLIVAIFAVSLVAGSFEFPIVYPNLNL
jgi:hypothetical protein